MKDLKDLKVGDKAYFVGCGWGVLTNNKNSFEYPLALTFEDGKNQTFTIDGKRYISDKHPSLFLTNPLEQQGKWMMVRSNEYDWNVKNVIVTNNGIYVESGWLEAKEIPEPNELILSMQEIADKFGVDVETLKIQK